MSQCPPQSTSPRAELVAHPVCDAVPPIYAEGRPVPHWKQSVLLPLRYPVGCLRCLPSMIRPLTNTGHQDELIVGHCLLASEPIGYVAGRPAPY